MLGITRGTTSCAVGSSSGAVQEHKYLLHYTENDRDRNIKLATTWAVTDLGNGDRNHGWSWRCSKVKEQHFFKLCLWNLCSQFKQDSQKQKECHDFCGCLQYQGINSMPFAWWTSNPSLTYVPCPLLCETANCELTFTCLSLPADEIIGLCHQIQLRNSS